MAESAGQAKGLKHLEDKWDQAVAGKMSGPELLRYRSNLLGSDLRLTNFGGGNTSSKLPTRDPLTGDEVPVMWVKGSGGDLGSIQLSGFATLYLEKLRSLKKLYRGAEHEDAMVEYYPLCTFGLNPTATSIDTPLHGFLPFAHVDHLHPDCAIALAAAANGREKMEEFNEKYGHRLIWLPWQRPGFELAMMLERAVREHPDTDGVILGGHGLFTWGETSRDCYRNTLRVTDDLTDFISGYEKKKGDRIFGGTHPRPLPEREKIALEILPFVRGRVSESRRLIGSYSDHPDVMQFVDSERAERFAFLGTSCPDHFVRTKIRPLYVPWEPGADLARLKRDIEARLAEYRAAYAEYYRSHAVPDSPSMRDPNPTVVLIPGLGMFSFGKNKKESRITGEFYINAIHVMRGASALEGGKPAGSLPQCGSAAMADAFTAFDNYVALPSAEAFRIEYWKLEEAKLRRQPPEKELSRQIVMVAGGASGIGRETALLAARRGAHVAVADRDVEAARQVTAEIQSEAGREVAFAVAVDITKPESIRAALVEVVKQFGGLDILINTAAVFPPASSGDLSASQWAKTFEVNVTANFLLAQEAGCLFMEQGLPANIVLTSSANAVVSKRGSEAYDVSKAALSHLIRELAVSLAPRVRVNGISPATVVKGSAMFPRERVIVSLKKYGLEFREDMSDDDLRGILAGFYAKRTLTHQPIDPAACAEAILFLAGPKAPNTTGHLIPVDGGLSDAFLR
jgi:rhamnose utilization protein RhaD (predicted bifunctional aldolase and dehydrogenase)/NAD(P)-dependent dehydrogenase (short-subunit alcohol dehydrogenase family)